MSDLLIFAGTLFAVGIALGRRVKVCSPFFLGFCSF